MDNNKLEILVTAKDSASNVIAGVSKSFDSLSDNAVNGSKKMLLGVAAVGAGIAAFGASSVKAYMDAEKAGAQLNAVLESTGHAAGLGQDELMKFATSLQRITPYSDEAIQGVESMLLTFTSLKGPLVKDATKTVLDMSTALGQDTKSSAIMLGKALQDPIMGVSALRRVGVNFSSAQQDVIKNLVDTNQVAKAQALIMKELGTEFGGSAAAAGKTFAGRLEILKNTFGDLQESVGQLILAGITPLITGFQRFIDNSGGFEGIVNKLKEAFKALQPYIPQIAGALTVMLIPALASIAASAAPVILTMAALAAVGALLGPKINQLVQHFGGWGKVMDEAKNAAMGVFNTVKLLITGDFKGGIFGMSEDSSFVDWLFKIRDAAINVGQFVRDFAVGAFNVLKQALDFLMPSLSALWQTISTSIIPALQHFWDVVGPFLVPTLKVLAAIIGGLLLGAIWLAINVLNIIIGVVTWFINVLASVINVVKNVVDFIVAYVTFLYNFWSAIFTAIYNVVKFAFDLVLVAIAVVISGIMAVVQPIANALSGPFIAAKNWIVGVWQGVSGWFGSVANSIGNVVGGVYDKLTAPFNRAFDWIKQIPGKIVDAVGNIGNLLRDKLGNWDIPGPLGKVKDVIPGFATGVENFKGGWAMVGERGPELVNLPRGASVVSNQDSKNALGGGGGGVTNNFNGTINLNSADAVEAFYARFTRDAELASMGVAT